MTPTELARPSTVKVVTAPRVYFVNYQEIDTGMLDFLIDHGVQWQTDTDIGSQVTVEAAGRICYHSFAKPRPGGNEAYIKHIKEVGHGSVIEHAVVTFTLTGVSRSLTHELVRHRAGMSYSQRSQRYCDESDLEFVMPPELLTEYGYYQRWLQGDAGDLTPEEYKEWDEGIHAVGVVLSAWATSQNTYRHVCDYLSAKLTRLSPKSSLSQEEKTDIRKRARGTARCVLPNATETKITVTANARALRTILEQRGSRFAEMEIRRLANVLLDGLKVKLPVLFSDYVQTPLPDGTSEITTKFPKV
jgi:thymidylate synthase (FAD)